MPYLEKWPPRPGAAPPEARKFGAKIWGTGAYNTIIFGTSTTHDLCNIYMYQLEGRHMAMIIL